jgi:KUP system potassium uptake protein
MFVVQTSAREVGQIYIPGANWVLLIVIVGAIIGFGSSTRLASAYGVAVTGTMLATTILTFFVIRFAWHYNLALSIAATSFFVIVDAAFFSSSLLKIAEGGWFPLMLGAIVFTLMTTWRQGRVIAMARQRRGGIPVQTFLDSVAKRPPQRVPGTAVFMAGNADSMPRALLQNVACNQVLHDRVVLLTVLIRDIPWVPSAERTWVDILGQGFYRLTVYFGFMDPPDVAQALRSRSLGLPLNPAETWFLLSRTTVIPKPGEGMALWRERLFASMARNARTAGDYFNIPSDQVIELGTKIEI